MSKNTCTIGSDVSELPMGFGGLFVVAATLVNDAKGGWPIEIGIPTWRGALESILLTLMPFKWFMYGTVVYAA